jgi:O-antigen/teichoic acid export membrane protein
MIIRRITRLIFQNHLLFTIWINVILAFLALASGGLAARLLGVTGRGELAAIQLWPTFLAGFSMLGLSDAMVYFTAKYTDHAGNYLISAIIFTLLISLPFMGLGYILIPILLASQAPDVVAASRIYLLMIPLFSLLNLPFQALRGLNDMLTWNWIRLIQPFGWVCILILLSLTGRKLAQEAAFGYIILVCLLILPTMIIILKRLPGPYRFERNLWPPMLRFGIPSVMASIPSILNLRLDQVLMAAFMAPEVLGLYVVAVAWASAVSPVINAIDIIIFPRVASQVIPADRMRILMLGIHLAVLVGLPVIVILGIITPYILPMIFGDNFRQAVPAALILLVAGVISNINSVMEDGARGLGKPSIALAGETVGLIATILALAIFLRPFGILGASVSSLLGYSGTMIALLIQISRIDGLHFWTILLPERSDLRWSMMRLRAFIGKE